MTDTATISTLGIRRPGNGRAISWISLAVLAVGVGGLSFTFSGYTLDLTTTLLLYVAGASAWNLISGMGGQFSLAHSVFVGAGSYAVVMVLRDLGWPVLAALAVAMVIGGLIALVLGAILFRLRGVLFTIGSLAAGMAALAWMTTWAFTGGTAGISAPIRLIPKPTELFFYALGVAVAAIAAAILIYYSRFGLRLMAVRDDEEVADSLGVSPFGSKLVTMVISGVLTALVGAVFALQRISVEPFSAFSLNWTISFVVMAIIGGLGSVWGPPLGAVLIYYGLTVQLQDLPNVGVIISGVLMVILIKFLPDGIVGGVRLLGARLSAARGARIHR